MTRSPTMNDAIVAGASLAAALLAGYLLDRLILRRVVRRATQTQWGADDVVVGAVHRLTIVWFGVLGVFVARLRLPLRPGVASVVDQVLVAVLIVTATAALARMAGDLLRLYALRNEGVLKASSIFVALAKLGVYVVGSLVLLQTLGVSITPMLTALGVGGLAVALAMQDTLSNLFAGVQIIASKKVRPGDYVRLQSGEEGYVTDVDWRHTSMRQLPNNLVLVPNAKLASAIVTNYNMPAEDLSVMLHVGVSYDSDLEMVEDVCIGVAREVLEDVPGGMPDVDPFVRFHTFGDSSIDLTVFLRARAFVDQYVLKHEFVKRLHRRFRDKGVEIPFPIRTVHLRAEPQASVRNGAASKMPRRRA